VGVSVGALFGNQILIGDFVYIAALSRQIFSCSSIIWYRSFTPGMSSIAMIMNKINSIAFGWIKWKFPG